jgi:hypothetical protein
MKTEAECAEDVKRLLRAEMARRGITMRSWRKSWPRSAFGIRQSICETKLREADSLRSFSFSVLRRWARGRSG